MSWEQIGNEITFRAFFVASKVGKTGLTVTVDVYRNDIIIVTGASATEVAGGVYKYALAFGSVTVPGEYHAIFKTADATVDQQHVTDYWIIGRAGVENLDAAISSRPSAQQVEDEVLDSLAASHNLANTIGAKINTAGGAADPLLNAVPGSYTAGTAGAALGKIGTGVFEVDSPIGPSGDISIYRGDDYVAADNRQIDVIGSTPNQWPDLTAATLAFTAREISSDAVILTKIPTVITPTGTQKVRIELTSSDSKNLGARTYKYDIEATLSSTRKVTLASGQFMVIEDQTR